jgi:hypothetical protein
VTRARGAALAAAALSIAWGASAALAAEAKASVDIDGDGQIETITARGKSSRVDLTVENASGRRLARTRVPAPSAGVESLTLRDGSLGSSGALLEVEASGGGEACRSVWRLRDGGLDRVPLRTGAAEIPACDREGWSTAWERPDPNSTAIYRRALDRRIDGRHHLAVQKFAYTGFALENDPGRGTASIDGMRIPRWPAAEMFPLDTLPRLQEAFDYNPIRMAPRLFLETEPDSGTFLARWKDSAGQIALPVRSASEVEPGVERLEASEGPNSAKLTVLVRNGLPVEATVTGLGDRFDRVYVPVTRRFPDRVVLYPTAEEDVAREILPGTWSALSGGQIVIEPAAGGSAQVAMDGQSFVVSIRDAPQGTDVVLIPVDGSEQAWALDLRTPSGLARAPAQCGPESGTPPRCRTTSLPGTLFRRVGARINR